MAMSMKKIGAIAVGGAMVASALATGAFAAEKVGDVDAFAADVVADGNANVDIVVGSNAAALDVVSAANVAAKIGSLMFKEGTVEDGTVQVSVSAESESDDADLIGDLALGAGESVLMAVSADSDYTDGFFSATNSNGLNVAYVAQSGLDAADYNVSLGALGTLSKIDDIDPSNWLEYAKNSTSDYQPHKADAVEFAFVKITNDSEDDLVVDEDNMVYATIAYNEDDEEFDTAALIELDEGVRVPFLGEEYAVMKLEDEDDYIVVGKEVFDGVVKEGDSYDVGNGYVVSIDSILKSGDTYKANVKILKDGKVVAEKFEAVDGEGQQLKMQYGDIAVVVNEAWENIGSDYGYAEVLIANNLKTIELGEEFVPDWEANVVYSDGTNMKLDDEFASHDVVGIALKYVGDKEDKLESGDELEIADYVKITLDDEDDEDVKLKAFFKMDESKEVSLALGQTVNVLNAEIKVNEIEAEAKEAVVMTAPIAVLDSEASLDAADKGLILVGGPVVNALTAELADAGLVAIDNESPATLAVAAGAANGNDVLVVAGGDRAATEEAAEALIEML
ncbi:S-layer protein (TIGR01564 family) [Methanococcus maripaludis]|uniref:S-layer protein (TIGR01564 family) n=1 Tax=Methanococcus maripaludis TaxID=39152 RepID=A0A7J9P6I4_METMI|nr:S-layer protein [Methanococcus maripaludis]MBA2858812.1 S-layer protein (TIGR01564 family) [Methanococcus maripaludis]